MRFTQGSMATSYRTDRSFTEYVHQRIALPQVYRPLGWSPFRLTAHEMEQLDRNHGIDRIFYTSEGYLVSVQERFRAGKYAVQYNDVTLRYRRDNSRRLQQRQSECFKIEADYLLYGIVDGSKKDISANRTFQKVVLLSIPNLLAKIAGGKIVVRENETGKSYWEGDRMIVPVNHNKDGSSSFVALDVPQIYRAWSSEIVVWQRGYQLP